MVNNLIEFMKHQSVLTPLWEQNQVLQQSQATFHMAIAALEQNNMSLQNELQSVTAQLSATTQKLNATTAELNSLQVNANL